MDQHIDFSPAKGCHCLAARRKARALTRLYEKALRPHGLRATQFSVLAALRLKGPTPVTELAELLGLERTTLTRGASLMERNGWIAPAPSDDARIRAWQLTAGGLTRLTAAFSAWRAAQRQAEQQFQLSS